MRVMTLTGIGSEQNFETGGTEYFLVFNKGSLRVPVSEIAAEVVIKEMYGQEAGQPEAESSSVASPQDTEQEDDDGVGQI